VIRKKTLHLSTMFLSILLQAISILQYYWKNEEQYTINWVPQYGIILIVSILLTILQYNIENPNLKALTFFIRYTLILITSLPTGIYIGLKQMFLFALLIDLSFLYAFPTNLLIAVASYLSIAVGTAASLQWTKDIPLFVLSDILYVSIFAFILIFLFSFFRYFYDYFTKDYNRIEYLNKTINSLTDANTGFQHYIQIAEEKSSEDERNRIIREVHDSTGYTLTTIIMLSASVLESQSKSIPEELREILSNIHTYAKNGLTDIRIALRILKVKKVNVETDLEKLDRMVTAFRRATNVAIMIDYGNLNKNYASNVSHLTFRLIQEGMVNSLRHGMATEIGIQLFEENYNLIITIIDNGTGFKELALGIGLAGMKERIEKIRGDFTIISSGKGVTLRASIPLYRISTHGAD
jgi:signal transduction histidine kinase